MGITKIWKGEHWEERNFMELEGVALACALKYFSQFIKI